MRANKIQVGLKHACRSVGAYWTVLRRIRLNSRHYTSESSLENPRAWTSFIHEVRHLQQGLLEALSIHGELDAWQYEFRLLKRVQGLQLHAALEEIITLPLDMDRKNLRRAQKLMNKFAGPAYLAWILPLYPIHKEVMFRLGKRGS